MKTIKYIAVFLCCTSIFSACSSNNEENVSEVTKVPLELTVSNKSTRAAIEGTTLPYQTSFGLFIYNEYDKLTDDPQNVSVFYDGNCKMSNDIYLSKSPKYVKAYWPYQEYHNNGMLSVNPYEQIDLLCGSSYDEEGNIKKVDQDNPNADLVFSHVMSRIVFKIRRTAAFGRDIHLSRINISNMNLEGQLDCMSSKIVNTYIGEWSSVVDINVSEDISVIDNIIIPVLEGGHEISLYDSEENIYNTIIYTGEWLPGVQYTYEIVFDDNGIKVSEAQITEWEVETQEGSEITDENIKN